jgi:acyl-CoA reductase-like NAD-dependent aldehyde dehydrogenase
VTTAWHDRAATVERPTRPFIDGGAVEAASSSVFASIGPRDGEVVARFPACDATDVDRAVAAARAAFDDRRWRDRSPAARKAVLLAFADLIDAHRDDLALLETLDTGKPIGDTTSVDATSVGATIRWYAEAIDKLTDEVAATGPDALATVSREPVGVVGAIVPWNYPLIITGWKLGPALATGNSVVVKPAEQSTMATLLLAELGSRAGLPDGVLNVVTGEGETGALLARHPDVDKLTFTGSTPVGREVLRAAADSNLKHVSLELGGKSPQLVFDDVDDLDAVVEGIGWGIFYNQGQTCHAGSRLVVAEGIADELIAKVAEFARGMVPGDPLDDTTLLGAMISHEQRDAVVAHLDAARAAGARVHGGEVVEPVAGGAYLTPAIVDHVPPDAAIAREEVFGPVLVVQRFDGSEAAGTALAADTDYGLAGAVWTSDFARGERAARSIRAGVVYVNCFDVGDVTVPHGGYGLSGFGGRDKSLHAFDQYTELTTIWRQR